MCVIDYQLENIQQYIPQDIERIALITDSNVGPLYAEQIKNLLPGYQLDILQMPAGENNKNRVEKARLEDQLLCLGHKRKSVFIALGGGVVTDLVGFIAATYCRGVPVIYIPTTLMAMVDAAIGGKNGINTDYGKNMLGTIVEPIATLINVSYLISLSWSDYIYAYSEVIKHALITNTGYFQYLKSNVEPILSKDLSVVLEIIKMSNNIKLDIVRSDPQDLGARAILNFGHSYAHAIELKSNYQIPHGQAVAVGIYLESLTKYPEKSEELAALLTSLGLNFNSPYPITELKLLFSRDKKYTK